jgi:membrane-bound metal-dependent hydrolase YbcI (DUF457 family)
MIGANSVWLLYFFQLPDAWSTVLLIAAGAFGALLPDLDASVALIHTRFHIFKVFRGTLRHRGALHSILAVGVVYLLAHLFGRQFHPLLPEAITLGYASHCFIDAFNSGAQYFYPWPKFVTFVPAAWRFRVGSRPDDLLFFLGALGIVGYVFLNQHSLFQIPNFI